MITLQDIDVASWMYPGLRERLLLQAGKREDGTTQLFVVKLFIEVSRKRLINGIFLMGTGEKMREK